MKLVTSEIKNKLLVNKKTNGIFMYYHNCLSGAQEDMLYICCLWTERWLQRPKSNIHMYLQMGLGIQAAEKHWQ